MNTPDLLQEVDRSLISQLIEQSRLYRTGPEYLGLLNFITRMRHIAPFNAMILQIQKPGLQFAASKVDWYRQHQRTIKEGARPLLILWPFSPVALVYDIVDTEGQDLPKDVAAPFRAQGDVTEERLTTMCALLAKQCIDCQSIVYGSGHAGHIQKTVTGALLSGKPTRHHYAIRLNSDHSASVRFATLAHELGHLYLGHLGEDKGRKIKNRRNVPHAVREIEAETVSYLACNRQGVQNVSESYLSGYVNRPGAVDSMDVYAITAAAGAVEQLLGVACKLHFLEGTSPT